jgi:hypothetical protein
MRLHKLYLAVAALADALQKPAAPATPAQESLPQIHHAGETNSRTTVLASPSLGATKEGEDPDADFSSDDDDDLDSDEPIDDSEGDEDEDNLDDDLGDGALVEALLEVSPE